MKLGALNGQDCCFPKCKSNWSVRFAEPKPLRLCKYHACRFLEYREGGKIPNSFYTAMALTMMVEVFFPPRRNYCIQVALAEV